jgi:hypothetical protein
MTTKSIAALLVAAALVAPSAGASGDGSPGPTSPGQSSAYARNDSAHFGQRRAAPAAVVVRVEGGFDWASAGIGAAGAVGIVLVTGGAASVLRRRHGAGPVQA